MQRGAGSESAVIESKLLNIKQAARLLNVSEVSLRRWTDRGQLPCLRMGAKRERRFREADLLAFLEHQPANGRGGRPRAALDPERHLFIEGLTVEKGSHLCALYESDLGRLKLSVPFLADGLRAGELCLLVAGSDVSGAIVSELRRLRPGLDDDLDGGNLVLSTGEPTGRALFEYLEGNFIAATRAGRPGIRVVGDMAASLSKGMLLEDLIAFEARYEQSLADQYPVVSLCQYDARKFPGVGVLQALKCHRDTFRYPLARFLS